MKNKIGLILSAVFVSLLSFVSAHTGEDAGIHHDMMKGVYGYGFMWMFGLVFMILFLVVLVLLIVWLIKQIQKPRRRK